ncbi:MAG: peptidoglycan-binding protein [Acidimicrobiales bacterium]
MVLIMSVLGVTMAPSAVAAQERPLLRLGSTGDSVATLETRLVELGFDPGTVDTTFDGTTRAAVIRFQRAADILVDGIVGPQTWGSLDAGVAPPPADPAPDPSGLLRRGDSGPAVVALQQELTALGYWMPGVDGIYGNETRHAVVALQKAAGLARDGIYGPNTAAALRAGTRPTAQEAGDHIEVDLTNQLLLVVRNGQVESTFDTATGRVLGTTPSGTYSVTRQIDGFRYAPLGTLYRPKYFYRGVAIHGYTSVPARPASHGCVRLTYAAMDHIWSSGVAPVGAPVVVYRR